MEFQPPPKKRPGIHALKGALRTGFYIKQTYVVRPLGRIFEQEVSGYISNEER